MELTEGLLTRRSIRKYTGQEISREQIETFLKAGMYAPSANNEQPWHFIAVNQREILDKLMAAHPYASMLAGAKWAIIVCADENLQKSKGYLAVDCAAATQNILLAAHAQGVGSVWLGVYPREDRMAAIQKVLNLPVSIMPFSMISLGYPSEQKADPNRFKRERIHLNSWE
ncbi:MAG: nitroreductase family protein [Bacteroidota bacterium]|nr:nitroreductase family protein [Bacteroidota bacterium]MDP4274270.1 nitroreductase family protein [Bacteroidota bacterium]